MCLGELEVTGIPSRMKRSIVISRLASLGLAIVLLALPGVGIWATTTTQRVAVHAKIAVGLSDSYQAAARSILAEAAIEERYRLFPTKVTLGAYRRANERTIERLLKIRDIGDPVDRDLGNYALAAQREYAEATSIMFAALDAHDPVLVELLDHKKANPAYTEMRRRVDARATDQHRQAVAALETLTNTQEAVRRTTLIISLFGIFLLAVFVSILRAYRERIGAALRAEVARLEREALTDVLTGLGNHRAYQEDLRLAIAESEITGEPLTLVLVDIDDFKVINDDNGHRYGDRILNVVGSLLRNVRVEDRAYRVGGDEFALILRDVENFNGVALGERLRRACAVEALGATLSVGVATLASGIAEGSSLHEQGDAALYEAKRRGRNAVVSFDDLEERTAILLSTKARALRALLSERNLGVVFQPIWDLERGAVLGYEALARPAADYGFSGPHEAFDVAERIGRIHDLDALCRDKIFERAVDLPDAVLLFINVSPQSLEHESFGGTALADVVRSAGLSPERVVVEVTERSMERPAAVIRQVERLRALGFKIALDDVGAGNAGLETLSRLPVDFLKVDRMIVEHALHERPARSVFAGIVAIAQENESYVIAEGIETPEMLAFVRDISRDGNGAPGVHAVQGYLLSRPSEQFVLLEEDISALRPA